MIPGLMTPSRDRRSQRASRRYQGGWLNLAIAGISALLGRSDRRSAERAAERDRNREFDLEERGLAISERQDERAGQLFEHYRGTYMPAEKALVREAFGEEISPARAEARATTDVRSSLENARRMRDRDRRRLGINPASGAGSDLGLSLEEARIEAGSRTRAREDVRDRNFARKATVLGYGSPTAAVPYSNAAMAGTLDAASLAGRRARESDRYVYEAGANEGAALGELADAGLEAWRRRRERSSGSSNETIWT